MNDEVYIRETGVEDCEYLEVCEHACRTGCRCYKPKVDRDALLELAEDVRGYCIERQITPWVAGRIYDRIREALGVEDG